MSRTLAGASLLALSLAISMQAAAQQTGTSPEGQDAAAGTPDPTDAGEGQLGIDAPVVITDPAADARDDVFITEGPTGEAGTDRLRDLLEALGADEHGDFVGALASARTEDGDGIAMLVGPDDLEAEDAGAFTFENYAEIAERLGETQDDVRQLAGWHVMWGRLDGQSVLALAAPEQAMRAAAAAGGLADGDGAAPGDALEQAGIDDGEDVEVAIFRGLEADGSTMFLVLGPEGFRADGALDVEDEDMIGRLEDGGLSDVTRIGEDARAFRGTIEGHTVLAFDASGFLSEPDGEPDSAAVEPADAEEPDEDDDQ